MTYARTPNPWDKLWYIKNDTPKGRHQRVKTGGLPTPEALLLCAGVNAHRPEFGYFAEYSASKRKYRIAFDDFEEDKPWYKLNEDGLTILAPIGARVQMLGGTKFGYLVDYRDSDGAYRIVFDDFAEDADPWYKRGVDFEVV